MNKQKKIGKAFWCLDLLSRVPSVRSWEGESRGAWYVGEVVGVSRVLVSLNLRWTLSDDQRAEPEAFSKAAENVAVSCGAGWCSQTPKCAQRTGKLQDRWRPVYVSGILCETPAPRSLSCLIFLYLLSVLPSIRAATLRGPGCSVAGAVMSRVSCR